MTKIIASAEVRKWTTRERDPEDRWDSGDTAGEVSNVVAFIGSDEDDYYSYGDSEERDLPGVGVGDTVYAVVADYESGSTFGRDGGYAKVLDVFATAAEAQALAEAALTPDGMEERWGVQRPKFDFNFTHNGKSYWRSWVGYFESLNTLDVWECVVKGTPKDPWSDDPAPGFKRGR